MPPLNVRVDPRTHSTLRELSAEYDETMSSLLAEAVGDLKRKRFLEAANADYAALAKDPDASRAEKDDRDAWDATLLDGLDE